MLQLKNISKDYMIDKKPFPALKHLNIIFPKKEFCCILGPSGCGKTTLLNIIGGLDQYTAGNLIIDGKSTKQYKSKDWDNYRNKRIGFIFQNYNLIEHLSILENVELALTLDGVKRKERKARAVEALKKVNLDNILNKKPNQLSGGQMQRVAIARALITNPEIILADEPTGALDSVTSVQVMNLIKELSKERLVIMVTHNEDLANKYATRIIKMKDGEVLSDSHPAKFVPVPPKKNKVKEKKKTSMSIFTALSMSLKNLFTKKGRTALTSIAASFGIIGVALVLALSNGFTNYVNRVEGETASQTPINLSSYTMVNDRTAEDKINETTKYPDTTDIYPYVSPSSNVTYKYNNFSEKYIKFLNNLKENTNLMNDYLINYVDNYSFNLVTEFPESIDGTNPKAVQQVNYISSSYIFNSLNSVTGLPTNYFHTLYGEEEYITDSYEVIEGSYPQNSHELVLVVDNCNRIDFSILKRLGFYNDIDENKQVEIEDGATKVEPLTWEKDIKNKKYKVFGFNDFYKKGDKVDVVDGDGVTRTLQNYAKINLDDGFNSSSSGVELKIVGILRPKETTTIPLMTTGLCFTKTLQDEILNLNKDAGITGDFEKNVVLKDVNGFGQKNFLSFLNELSNISTSGTINETALGVLYNKYFSFRGAIDVTTEYSTMSRYLTAAEGFGCEMIPQGLLENGITDSDYMKEYMNSIMDDYTSGNYASALQKVIGIYAYVNSYSVISNIVIFPKDLTTKEDLKKALDEYNVIGEGDDHANSEKEQIYYTDIVSTLTSGLGKMITIISVVLIIFASISLLVSCVMTGIITYTSVLERTKEIGLLRAVGARKKDVGRLFKAESSIIGGMSGIIGCVIAYLICIPTNIILNNVYTDYNLGQIADLNIYSALALVAISLLLTLISGLIPSRIASKKNPVVALRTE